MTKNNRPILMLLVLFLAAAAVLPTFAAPRTPSAPKGKYVTVTPVDITANDLLYDPARDVVYASVPSSGGAKGNSIVRITPDGGVGEALFVGSEPNVMALSANGAYLYVGIDGAGAFRRVALADDSIGPLWPLGSDGCGSTLRATDMVGLLGEPQAVAVARAGQCGYDTVAVYDNGAMRPETLPAYMGLRSLEPSGVPGALFGYSYGAGYDEFYVLATSAEGITRTMTLPGLVTGFADIHYANGFVYATRGQVVDAASLTLAGTYAAQGPLAVDSAAGAIAFVEADFFTSSPHLKVFDLDTFLPLFSAPLPPLVNEMATPLELLAVDDAFFIRQRDGRVMLWRLVEQSAVSGRVTNQHGSGIQGVVISDGAGHTATTDWDGYYTLAPLPDGTHTLTPSFDGYNYIFDPPSIAVTVPPDVAGQDFRASPVPTQWGVWLPLVRR